METIAVLRAQRLIEKNGRLENVHVPGELIIREIDDDIRFPIEFRNCELDHLNSGNVQYCEPVLWDHCVFKKVDLSAVYLSKGLTCRDCEFTEYFRWDMGGHNIPEGPILFKRVKFHTFADFWDSAFEGPFVMRDVEFEDGTNLMEKRYSMISFEYPPVLERVRGELDQHRNVQHGGTNHGYAIKQDKDGWWVPTGKKSELPPKRSPLKRILGK